MRVVFLAVAVALVGCARPSQMPPGPDWGQYVVQRPGATGPASYDWRPEVCAQIDLRPDYRVLDETHLIGFLRDRHLDARVERQPVEANQPPLLFVFVATARGSVPLRVAILPSADDAGRALYDALLQHPGGWGVHRANLAVLGPAGAVEDDLAFAGATKLGCWGTFTFADSSDAFVVPGGYAEP